MAILYAYQQCSANLQIDDSRFERLDPKGCPPPGRKSHPFVLYLQKAKKKLVSEINAFVKIKYKVWRWLKEKVETGLCLARFASRRCV